MGKLTRLVIASYLGPFILTFAIAMVFLILQFLWKYVDDLMGKGLEWYVVAELLFYASANLVPMALPLAILLSSIMVFGNLGESSELTAMRSAGLSLMRIMRPLIIFIAFISISAFFFANYLWPVANMKFRSLIFDIQNQKPALTLTERRFYNDIPGFSIRVMEKTKEGSHFKDILIYDHSTGNVNFKRDIWAESGNLEKINGGKGMLFHLNNGKIYEEVQGRMMKGGIFPYQKIQFKKASLYFDLSSFQLQRTDVQVFNTHYEMMNMAQLASAEDSLRMNLYEKRKEMSDNFARRFLIFRPVGNFDPTHPVAVPTLTLNKVANQKPILKSANDSIQPSSVNHSFVPFREQHGEQRTRTLASAQSMARNSLEYILGRKEEFTGREEFIQRHRLEWHRKLTLSVACFILFFIGAPLGAIIRKGGLGTPIVASTILFIFYYILSISGEKMAKANVLDPFWGMWMSSFILFPVGLYLTWKSNNDSALFDKDFYLRLFRIKRLRKS